jgi:glycerol-3-phosphate acyltransferase PlsX
MRIALDVMGGDKAPEAIVAGAVEALHAYDRDLQRLYLVGDETAVKRELDRHSFSHQKVEIVHSSEVVTMHDSAVKSVRQKKDSSISVSVDLVKRGGIASPLPNEFGPCNIMDAGANVDAKPSHLLGYAIMGSVYARHVQAKEKPVVGLMSVGEEDSKGTDFTREVFELLRSTDLNFRGNVEGHDLFESQIDVVVCDGFVGNVILKSCEATAKAMFKWLKQEINANPIRKVGALIAKDAFKAVKERGNYETYGGSPLLGVNGVCIIGHGSSSPLAVRNAIRVALESVKHQVNPHIEEEMDRYSDLIY